MSAYYPGEKEEFWWLVIGDKKTNKVLTTKRTLIKKTVNLNLSFELKDVAKPVLYALCDSYIGRDQAE